MPVLPGEHRLKPVPLKRCPTGSEPRASAAEQESCGELARVSERLFDRLQLALCRVCFRSDLEQKLRERLRLTDEKPVIDEAVDGVRRSYSF